MVLFFYFVRRDVEPAKVEVPTQKPQRKNIKAVDRKSRVSLLCSSGERVICYYAVKGVLGTEKQSFVLFDVVTHPVADGSSKKALVSLLQSSLLSKWQNDLRRFDKRVLSLVYLAHSADVYAPSPRFLSIIMLWCPQVLDPVLDLLSDETYNLAMKHISKLLDVNFENEAVQEPEFEVMWAVFDVFSTR
jgi:Golgi phosphoprotein 3